MITYSGTSNTMKLRGNSNDLVVSYEHFTVGDFQQFSVMNLEW